MTTRKAKLIGNPGLFFECFFRRTTVLKAVKVSLVVGLVLVLVNHFELLFGAALSLGLAVKLLLCFLVPFCVSGYSSATAVMTCGEDSLHSASDEATDEERREVK